MTVSRAELMALLRSMRHMGRTNSARRTTLISTSPDSRTSVPSGV